MTGRITITLDCETLDRIRAYCRENNLAQSQFCKTACIEYIKAKSIEPELKLALETLAQKVDELAKKAH